MALSATSLRELRDAERRSYYAIQTAFGKVVRLAALPETKDGKVGFHTLRHTGISRLANASNPTIPLVWVRDFAGHESLTTTETYCHVIENAAVTAAAVEAMTLEHSWNTEPGTAGSDRE